MQRPLSSIDILVGKAFARLRLDRGFSVEEMAAILKIKPSHIEAVEAGMMRLPAQMIMRASVQFGLPIATFYE